MTNKKSWLLIVTLVILATVGLPLIKSESVPAQAEQQNFFETLEYQTAIKLAESNVRLNCFQFKVLWQTLFPNSNCYRLQIGKYGHWECDLNDELIIDANYNWDNVIRIRKK